MNGYNIKRKKKLHYRHICIAMIWSIILYSSVIQFIYKQLPYVMLILGAGILLFYVLAYSDKHFVIREVMTEEGICFLIYMVYMLIVGIMLSPRISDHISQWITCIEYLFLLIVITSLIKDSGTDTFHTVLLIQALILSFVFLWKPVPYGGNRYSISIDMNPNGLGMNFATGIWVTLYMQQEKRMSQIFVAILIALFGYCIFLTGSRKALIASGLIVLIWLFFCFIPSIKEQKGYNKILSIVALCSLVIIIGGLFVYTYSDSTIAARMKELFIETTEGKRSNMYRNGFELIKENPLFGLGFQGYRYYYGGYSHATLVEIPVSSGIIGSIIYLGIYLISIRKTLRLCLITKKKSLMEEHIKTKMILGLWTAMLFYTTCIIHQYQFDSYILFGLIFGETAYIEKTISINQFTHESIKMGSKYIK